MSDRVALMLPRLSNYGGAEGFALRLAKALAAEGIDVDYICARQETIAPEGVNAVTVGRPPFGRACKVAWFAYAAERARKRGGYGLTISMGKTHTQDILRMSGGPLSIFWKLSSRAYAPGVQRKMKMLRRRTAPANMLIRKLEKESLENNELCVTVSHRVRDWLLEAHPWLETRPMRIIYNRPDLTRFSPADEDERRRLRRRMGIEGDRPVLSLAGTNFALKGLGTAIEALPKIPGNPVLLVAGDRNAAFYKAQADRLGVGKQVRFLGRVDDMPALYRASDAFCLPSFYDTCSNAVLEALASGTRVISSRDNGSSYFLPERWVVDDSGDSSQLAAKMTAALSEPRPKSFQWPDDVECGIDPYIAMVKERLS